MKKGSIKIMTVTNRKLFVSLFFLSMLGCKSSATSNNQGSLTSTQLSSTTTKGAQNPYGGEQTNPNGKKPPSPPTGTLIPNSPTTYIGPGSVVDIVFYPSNSNIGLTSACTLMTSTEMPNPAEVLAGLGLSFNTTTCEVLGTVSSTANISSSLNFVAQSTNIPPNFINSPVSNSTNFTLAPLSLAPDPGTNAATGGLIASASPYKMFPGFPTLITFMLQDVSLNPGDLVTCERIVTKIPGLRSQSPETPLFPNSPYFAFSQSVTITQPYLPGQPACTVKGSGLVPASGIPSPVYLTAGVIKTPQGEVDSELYTQSVAIEPTNNNAASYLLITESTPTPTTVNVAVYPAAFAANGAPSDSLAPPSVTAIALNSCSFVSQTSSNRLSSSMLG